MATCINTPYYNTNINSRYDDIYINPNFNKIHLDPSITNIKYDPSITNIKYDKKYNTFDKQYNTFDKSSYYDLGKRLNKRGGEKLKRTKTCYNKSTQTANKENITKNENINKNENISKVKKESKFIHKPKVTESFETTDPSIVELSNEESAINAQNMKKQQEEMDYLPDDYQGIVIESRSNSIDEKSNPPIKKETIPNPPIEKETIPNPPIENEMTMEEMRNICVINGDDFNSPLICDLTEEESMIKARYMRKQQEDMDYLPDDYEDIIIEQHFAPEEESMIKIELTINAKHLEKYREFIKQLGDDSKIAVK